MDGKWEVWCRTILKGSSRMSSSKRLPLFLSATVCWFGHEWDVTGWYVTICRWNESPATLETVRGQAIFKYLIPAKTLLVMVAYETLFDLLRTF